MPILQGPSVPGTGYKPVIGFRYMVAISEGQKTVAFPVRNPEPAISIYKKPKLNLILSVKVLVNSLAYAALVAVIGFSIFKAFA
ncbi:hypothetical protein [Achromobacter phage Motura]|uniref:Uncharacterized protein n=1 Tax=Achromobacter phage Motura TaxID=2591403 RepID=A0A514CSK4_9CAUD|nr:hypothetical protein H1O15_gp049 [Achromobacter phage Motura]QDH83457.1 hypothetical protein [Achromobacter phage Motura]